MKIKEILTWAAGELENISESPMLDARVILSEVIKKDNLYFITHKYDEVPEDISEEYHRLINLRKENMPVAYITNRREFMSMDFYVDERVLIPRADTEILVEKAIEIIGGNSYNVLDMCCGSGCIGLSVKKYSPQISLTLADISEGALEVTKINSNKHFPGNNLIKIIQTDLFENITGSFDMILSNPPYISFTEMKTLSKDIINYEPHLALEAEDEGLYFYEKITTDSAPYLKAGGYILYEIGSTQAEAVSEILRKNNFTEITVLKDYAGLDRVVMGKKQ